MRRWFIDAMSYMALGLFCSLITGLILTQLASVPFLSFLRQFTALVSASSPVVGAAIGAAIAYGLKGKPLVVFSGAVSGAIGYSFGGPVGAYLSALLGSEAAALVAGRTPFDIVLVPAANIIIGGLVGMYAGPGIQAFMDAVGGVVNRATELRPVPMGMLVSTVMGLALTAPISSAAISISLGLDGLAAGAACAGCCAQMVGFAVQSWPDNGAEGLLSQGLGTSMLQFGNIMRKPVIWLPPTLASAMLGPLSAAVFRMRNNPLGGGMGTSGLVGQFGAWASMKDSFGPVGTLLLVLLMHFALPALLTWLIASLFRKLRWIVPGDMKLKLR
ncbi:MAG TPA: PTS sugar transporter subunit IIC [Candidatus Limnocylindria bacterium]|nr:PTS sugar transporter subunit IIC [Candidatus Limnocylindria bacterium]